MPATHGVKVDDNQESLYSLSEQDLWRLRITLPLRRAIRQAELDGLLPPDPDEDMEVAPASTQALSRR